MILKYKVTSNDLTIKQILKEKYHISQKLITKLKKNKQILVNDIPVYINHPIVSGDILCVNLDFDEESKNIVSNTNIKLSILFEDDGLLILDKEANIPVHPSIEHYTDSLSNGVKYYFDKNHIKRKIRPVNRLDRDTSGIVVFAKNEYIQESLVRQMNLNLFKKYYIAILEGKLSDKSGTINAPIARKDGSIIEREISENGAKAISHYKVLEENANYSKVEFILETGRTHQIRVHSKYIGHPIVGDFLYGTKKDSLNRHLLHCYKIEFIHPITKEKLTITSDLPKIFNDIFNTI